MSFQKIFMKTFSENVFSRGTSRKLKKSWKYFHENFHENFLKIKKIPRTFWWPCTNVTTVAENIGPENVADPDDYVFLDEDRYIKTHALQKFKEDAEAKADKSADLPDLDAAPLVEVVYDGLYIFGDLCVKNFQPFQTKSDKIRSNVVYENLTNRRG